MALMTSMRERMHVVLWALLALFLLSMTIGGLVGGANIIDQLFGNVNPQTTIARINGENISPDNFNNRVSQQLQNSRSAGQNINDFQLKRARDAAWDQLLQDVLVSQAVERLNITASDEEVMFHLENNPPPFLTQNQSFQTDGSFDMSKYLQALANPDGNEWAPIESFMKNTFIPNYKLQKMLDESIVITENDIKTEFIKRNINFTLTGAHITDARVAKEDAKATEEELKAEYEKTRSDHTHEGLRSITYVSWKKEPSSQDTNSAKVLATKLMKRAKSGEDFSALANEYSMDPGNQNVKGGDLGWFKQGRMVEAFDEVAFKTKKGEIVGPVESNFGFHVIFVRDNRIDENGDKEVLASHILIKTEMSPSTLSNLKKDATLFSYDAQDDGFDKAVSDHGLETASFEKFDDSGYSVTGLGGLRAAIRFAFNAKLDGVSDILENNQYFVVCKLDSIIPAGYKDYEEVRSQIELRLNREKVRQATLEEANNLLIKLSASDMTLKELIESEQNIDGFKEESKTLLQGFQTIGRSHFVNGAILDSEPGKILGPLETNRGHTIVELIDIAEFDSTAYKDQKEKLRELIFTRKQNGYFQAWMDELKENADIVDNRKFYF